MAIQKERRAAPRKPAPAVAPRATLSNEEIYQLIAETAYFQGEGARLRAGGEVQDWIDAEREVRRRLDTRGAR